MLLPEFMSAIGHFFPQLLTWLNKVPDKRQKSKTTYSQMSQILAPALLVFCCHLTSRRQITFDLKKLGPECVILLWLKLTEFPHGDTINDVLDDTDHHHIEKVKQQCVHRLIRMRMLEKFRLLDKYYPVAIDGSGLFSTDKQHCKYCLVKRSKETGQVIKYHHYIVDSKLVTSSGFVASLVTEFLENIDPDASKQDCEQNAVKRIAPALKKAFPRTPFCILLDGLHSNGPVFGLCEDNNWKYIIILKDNLQSVANEFETLKTLSPENKVIIHRKDGSYEEHRWVNNIEYKRSETSKSRSYYVNVLQSTFWDAQGKKSFWRWVTNIRIHENNAAEIATHGRLRWKQENEGFNEEKNGGYDLEHQYSKNWQAQKCWIQLLLIAAIIMNLFYRTTCLSQDVRNNLGGIRKLGKRLLEAIRWMKVSPQQVSDWLMGLEIPC